MAASTTRPVLWCHFIKYSPFLPLSLDHLSDSSSSSSSAQSAAHQHLTAVGKTRPQTVEVVVKPTCEHYRCFPINELLGSKFSSFNLQKAFTKKAVKYIQSKQPDIY
ncbi:hypothetical protein AMECASPLE_019837 [Ameca splendens]|uniref:Uncharacterized protein n=1 Tax=Ameca splendens TaxID=208324 RepID=A0ABV0ZMX0_9TELE